MSMWLQDSSFSRREWHFLVHVSTGAESSVYKNPNSHFDLCSMGNMPGIMSRMYPLPVSLNEELASIALPNASQVISQASFTCYFELIRGVVVENRSLCGAGMMWGGVRTGEGR